MRNIYLRIASNSISKNSIVYVPFVVANAMMSMMLYFLAALSFDPKIRVMNGGETFEMISLYGLIIFLILSIVFIFYLSFFIGKKRRREYSILNSLGMQKKHLLKLMFVENSILAIIGSFLGIIGGVVFYKLLQLALAKFLNGEVDYSFYINWFAVLFVLLTFIFMYLVNFAIQIFLLAAYRNSGYVRSSRGARVSKLNIALALIGLVIMILAYKTEMSIPLSNVVFSNEPIQRFFVACILIFISTFMFFMNGFVCILQLLRKNKKFFYRKANFINISGLFFRMKRSGAGLAAICILSSAAIVLASAILLFLSSADDYLSAMNSESFIIYSELEPGLDARITSSIEKASSKVVPADSVTVIKSSMNLQILCRFSSPTGRITENYENIDLSQDKICAITDLDSYNMLTGNNIELEQEQMGFVGNTTAFRQFCDSNGDIYEIENLDSNQVLKDTYYSEFLLVVPGGHEDLVNYYTSNNLRFIVMVEGATPEANVTAYELWKSRNDFIEKANDSYTYIVKINDSYEKQFAIYNAVVDDLGNDVFLKSSLAEAMERFGIYNGLIFLCMMLLIIFIFMISIILYYKNLFDGLEDADNYELMRKVGLDDKTITVTVNVQMLTTIILPIVLASIHSLFSERFVINIVSMFNLGEPKPFIKLAIISAIVTILIYAILGLLTSRTYIRIVKGKKNQYREI